MNGGTEGSGTRAVSPVIGVVLLVAIVLALGAVTTTLALGLADTGDPAPQVRFSFAVADDGTVTVTHEGGATIDADALRLHGEDPDGAVSFGAWPASGTFSTGDSVVVPNATGDETLRVVWRGGDRSFTLKTWTGPGEPAGAALAVPEDPGHAYYDRNFDGDYDAGTDRELTRGELEAGVSDSGRLVVPSSLGTVSLDTGADFEADGIYLAADVVYPTSSSPSPVVLDARSGDLFVDGGELDFRKQSMDITLRAGGTVDLAGERLTSNSPVTIDGGTVDLTDADVDVSADQPLTVTSAGAVEASGASLVAENEIAVTADGDLTLTNAVVHADKDGEPVRLESTGGDIDLTDATLRSTRKDSLTTFASGNDLSATVNGGVIVVDGAAFLDQDNTLQATGTTSGTPASGSVS
ncbi:type IV pilin N-terminal domain-containing protein [Halosegnis marinus]|uniref:Type IV pilin N-terminal domain-containing protein n=1 Tax=Halosegnis marinus TaxID=3034023 RepID=A0ABD5ZQD4_9EURY|nr:type IV pilin N-terminal domain-containing protein [Halosegnis sp. DT85]